MAQLAHITDLHSGRHDDRIADALIDSLSEQAPDQIVIGGDLTQRSRRSEWKRAVGWLDRMPAPWIATPGNHDIPMFDFTRRAVSPFGRFRLNVGEDLEPSARVDGALVICVRTASPHRRVEGAVSRESLTQLRETLDAGRGDSPIVLVTHHPLALHPASQRAGHTVVSGDELLSTAEAGGVDLLLSGHTHRPHRGRPFSVNLGGRNLIAAHGGTACSTRTRADEPPSWQMVTMEPSRIAITMFAWDGDRFTAGDQSVWERTESAGWMEER